MIDFIKNINKNNYKLFVFILLYILLFYFTIYIVKIYFIKWPFSLLYIGGLLCYFIKFKSIYLKVYGILTITFSFIFSLYILIDYLIKLIL